LADSADQFHLRTKSDRRSDLSPNADLDGPDEGRSDAHATAKRVYLPDIRDPEGPAPKAFAAGCIGSFCIGFARRTV